MNDSLSSSLSVRTENKMLIEKRLTPSLKCTNFLLYSRVWLNIVICTNMSIISVSVCFQDEIIHWNRRTKTNAVFILYLDPRGNFFVMNRLNCLVWLLYKLTLLSWLLTQFVLLRLNFHSGRFFNFMVRVNFLYYTDQRCHKSLSFLSHILLITVERLRKRRITIASTLWSKVYVYNMQRDTSFFIS